jgi:hypothetical protein
MIGLAGRANELAMITSLPSQSSDEEVPRRIEA